MEWFKGENLNRKLKGLPVFLLANQSIENKIHADGTSAKKCIIYSSMNVNYHCVCFEMLSTCF